VNVSIRLRLALCYAGLTGLVVLLCSALGYGIHSRAHYDLRDQLLIDVTRHGANEYFSALKSGVRLTTLDTPASPEVDLRVYDATGQVTALSPDAAAVPAADPREIMAHPSALAYDPLVRLAPPMVLVPAGSGRFELLTAANGARWRIYVEPLAGGGYMEGTLPLSLVDASDQWLGELVPVVTLLSAAGTLFAGWLLARRALRPVAALTETADTIARSHDFSRRVPVTTSIDELSRLATTFNTMLTSLAEAYKTQQRFVSDASHELRAPLTAIQANLEILGHQATMTAEERQEAVDEASREAYRLSRLVADLLALARADAGVSLKRQRIELDRVVLDVLKEVRLLARNPGVDIVELEPVIVEGDADRLKQLLLSLVDNALKYTPPNGHVSLRLRREGAGAQVTVTDSGVGISPTDLPHVFERFYRADAARTLDPSGTGLGLPIAQWIARQHGGEVTLTSELGKGTVATFRLPVHVPTSEPDQSASTPVVTTVDRHSS
jgi:signal transduction histidine kinase